jgi:hypothetical protein
MWWPSKDRPVHSRWPAGRETFIDAGLVLACVGVAVFGAVVAGWFHHAFAS